MSHLFAIDFGTTNSVIARWNAARAEAVIERLPDLSSSQPDLPPVIPSLLYVQDGATGRTLAGQIVRDEGFDQAPGERLFRSFKRGIVSGGEAAARQLDGRPWTDRDAGQHFLRALLKALPETLEQLVVTAPVAAFSSYLTWLGENLPGIPAERIQVVDESTAAALGYAVTRPGALVLVVDFGGGTLDVSLVELPSSREHTGGLLARLRGGRGIPTARVIAKAGRVLGGSDVDGWLLDVVLAQAGLKADELGPDRTALLTRCENAKIALSSAEQTTCQFAAAGRHHSVTLTRAMLETLLARQGFFAALNATLERVMHVARRQGIFKEDIQHVLLVGGTALMPSVQAALSTTFGAPAIHADKPFTAVAEGALQVAAGFGLDDYLSASTGLRHLDPATGQIAYDEIIPEGTRYPMPEPVNVILRPGHTGQAAIELVFGTLGSDSVAAVELQMRDGQAIFVGHTDSTAQRVTPLNAADPVRIHTKDPVRALIRVDDGRRLRVTVTDMTGRTTLVNEQMIARLGEGMEESPTAGRSLIPEGVEDLAAYFRARIAAEAAGLLNPDPHAGPPADHPTGFEPVLGTEHPRGQQRLSLRRLGAMLNVLPPDAITLDAARAMLDSPEFYVRYNAARMLARRGDRPAREVLAAALESDFAPARASAARHLYGFTWHAAAPLLDRALADEDLRVREAAIYALCDLRLPAAYARAAGVVACEGDDLRAAAAWGLREDPSPLAVPVLQAALLARDPEVRVNALEALGVNATPEALQVVRAQIAADPDPAVQYAAALSLLEIAESEALGEIAALILAAAGECREALLRALFHASNYLKLELAANPALPALLEALAAALADPHPGARMAAVWPLAWLADDRAARIVVDAFARESDSDVRAHMRRVCASLNSPAAKLLGPAAETIESTA